MGWIGLVGVTLSVLVVLHGKVDAQVMMGLRLAALLTVILGWRYIVDILMSRGWVHPMRRSVVIASRWRVLGLVVLLEIFVIQQIPQLMVEIVRI